MRKPQGSFRRRRIRNREIGHAGSDEDEEDVNGEGGKDAFPDEPSTDVRQKRYKRWAGPRFSPACANTDGSYDEADDTDFGRESTSASPGRAGTPEGLVWGKGGTRSQTRYSSLSGSNGKHARSSRISKLADYFRNLDENDDEVGIKW